MALQDTILGVAAIPARPEKTYAQARREVGGGPAATAAVAVARLGGRASIAARIGDDATGAAIRREFADEGVDTTWLKAFAGVRSSGSVVLVDDHGERMIVAYADPGMPAAADWLEPENLGGALLCDLSWPQGAAKCMERARALGVPSVVDADISRHLREDVETVIGAADYVIFSRPGLSQFSGTEEIEAGLRLARQPGHRLTGVTDGAAGLYWLDGEVLRNAPPPTVRAVDTVGAGDAFHGAFALALSHAVSLAEAIRFSNAVAALKCTAPGGRAGLPTLAALRRFDPELDLAWIAER